MPNKKMFQGLNMNSNTLTGLPAPSVDSDAATKQYVDQNAGGATTASELPIVDTAGVFTAEDVEGALTELFTFANDGKTLIANAIGSPATSGDTFTTLAGYVEDLANVTYGVEKQVAYDETIAKGDVVESYYKSINLTRLTQPSVLPEGNANAVAWSADGKLFAVAHTSNSFVSIFNYDEATNTFTNFADPTTLPTNEGNGLDFSKNGDYLAVAHSSSPQCSIYKRSASSFVKLANLPSNPNGTTGRCVAFSPNSNYLSLGQSGGFGCYFRSGESFTRLTDNSTSSAHGNTFGTAWSPDSKYTIACYAFSPFIKFIKIDGDGTTATMNRVASSEALDAQANEAAWSPDGQYVAIAYGGTSTTFGSNRIAIYKQSGDTFTRLSVLSQPTAPAAVGVSWSRDGRYIYVTTSGAPSFLIIKRTGDTFTFITTPTAPYGTLANSVAVHPNNDLISIGHDANSFITHYKNDGVRLFTKLTGGSANSRTDVIGIAKQSGGLGETNKIVDVLTGGALLP